MIKHCPECPKLKCQPCKHQFVFENGCQTCECRDMCSELSTAVCNVLKLYIIENIYIMNIYD